MSRRNLISADQSDPLAEVRSLAYAMFDGVLDARGITKLERLILSDPHCLQTYLEVANLQCDLINQSDLKADREAVLGILQQFTVACDQRKARQQRQTTLFFVTASVLLVSCAAWFLSAKFLISPSLGSIAHLSSNVVLKSGPPELGQVLRQGKTISVQEGIVSLELGPVLVDLVGPAEARFDSPQQIQLHQGKVTVHVQDGGEGFVVRTPDAEVKDFGTIFVVNYDSEVGTDVSVRKGRVKANLLNSQGAVDKVLDLTADRSARLNLSKSIMEEVRYRPDVFQEVDRTRGLIRSLSGQLRTISAPPTSLTSEALPTPNHLLVIPERQQIRLEEDLLVEGRSGPVRLAAGSLVSSYLIHYDPTVRANHAPRGTVTFFSKVAAVLVDSPALLATDSLFGLPGVEYEVRPARGLEPIADEVQISEDRHSVSFFFGMAPPQYLDQTRILVVID